MLHRFRGSMSAFVVALIVVMGCDSESREDGLTGGSGGSGGSGGAAGTGGAGGAGGSAGDGGAGGGAGDGGAGGAGGTGGSGPTYNYAFISPEAKNGDLGGLVGADSLCEQWAADAGIQGTYRAILSTATTNAQDRLTGARGWIRPDGRPVADLPTAPFERTSGLLAPVRIAPNGDDVGDASVWSASGNDGVYRTTGGGDSDCGGWTSADGGASARYGFSVSTVEWLYRGTGDGCDQTFHIYCFQVDYEVELRVEDFAQVGRRLFVSSDSLDLTSGIDGADALCAADASAAPDLSGASFKAFLADVGTSAASRFSSSGTPVVRLDGLLVANDFDALLTDDLVHPPNLRTTGIPYDWRVFVGANSPTEEGDATSTCGGWSSTAGNADEGFAPSTAGSAPAERRWFGNASGSCLDHSDLVPVYCLEE
jgi:hypothetical protein